MTKKKLAAIVIVALLVVMATVVAAASTDANQYSGSEVWYAEDASGMEQVSGSIEIIFDEEGKLVEENVYAYDFEDFFGESLETFGTFEYISDAEPGLEQLRGTFEITLDEDGNVIEEIETMEYTVDGGITWNVK